ncbi:MAG: SIMPL domain-containing protein [Chlamydiia bacterium]|nr:SIMPL domain-containing protein [Chlamydiia bacterium]
MRRSFLVFACMLVSALGAAKVEERLLLVTGQGRELVQAEEADVRVGIEVSGHSAQAAQNDLATALQPVLAVLREKGALKLETGGISVYPEYSKNSSSVIIGYRGNVTVKFSTTVNHAGELIDAAIAAGANKVQGVTVRPARELMDDARATALRNAARHALMEARVLLDELGLKERGVFRIDVDSAAFNGRSLAMYKAGAAMDAASIEILAEEQEVNASVTLSIEFEVD